MYVGACLSKENTIVLESDAFIKCHCFCSKQPSNGCGRRSACVCVSVCMRQHERSYRASDWGTTVHLASTLHQICVTAP